MTGRDLKLLLGP